jgi:hypothetical protein
MLNRTIGHLASSAPKPHHFVTLHTSATETTSPPQPDTLTDDDVRAARRHAVEQVVELYVQIKHDFRGIRLNAAVLAALKDMSFRSGKDLRNWYHDVDTAVARMKRACLCRRQSDTCVHAKELERAAELNLIIGIAGKGGSVRDRQLGSVATRNRMSKTAVVATEKARAEAKNSKAAASSERRSIVHRNTYAEAIDLFVIACPGYCFHVFGEQ